MSEVSAPESASINETSDVKVEDDMPSNLPLDGDGDNKDEKPDSKNINDDGSTDSDSSMPPLERFSKEMDSLPQHNKNIVIPGEEGTGDKKPDGDSPDTNSDDDGKDEYSMHKDGWLDILNNGDLKKKVIKPGTGGRPPRGSKVAIRMVTRLLPRPDGNDSGVADDCGPIVADETHDRFVMVIGDNDLFQGIDLIVPLMDLHEICRAIVQPRFGYGQIGNKASGIPEGSGLDIEIELLEIVDKSDNIYGDDPGDPNTIPNSIDIDERIRYGNYKKGRGNFWFSRGEYSTSMQCYRGALKYLDASERDLKLSEDYQSGKASKDADTSALIKKIEDLIDKRAQTYNNLAAAQLKIQAFDQAMRSVEDSLLLRPNNVKALYRRGKLRAERGDIDEAIDDLKRALTLDPTSESVSLELDRLNRNLARQLHDQRQLYRRMMQTGQSKNKESGDNDEEDKDNSASSSNSKSSKSHSKSKNADSSSSSSNDSNSKKKSLMPGMLGLSTISAIVLIGGAVLLQAFYK